MHPGDVFNAKVLRSVYDYPSKRNSLDAGKTRLFVQDLTSMKRIWRKTRVLIVAEACLDLAERTTPLVERESGEAHRIIERPLSNVTTPRYRSAAD
jgi:hypothetical protein